MKVAPAPAPSEDDWRAEAITLRLSRPLREWASTNPPRRTTWRPNTQRYHPRHMAQSVAYALSVGDVASAERIVNEWLASTHDDP
jgi:hypothetical protein